ncbi:dnaJ homolog subfamily C member 1 [Carcharodon carcharias]|uniref:dnaJ homolog subfamily C member 1 n=1 Tax=Carcharodon carcharias TaxID=13397 RepID=UPI001B7E5F7E|nr:dnaJ homolog subfamily C member 1 [Carcharodon carcharias]
MPSPFLPALWVLLLMCVPHSLGWDTAEMELFDLVEEVQENFYRFLGVEQDASSADIRKAYRKMSLILHPDKNKDENAEIQFRQLVAIYEVLKDEEKRQRYDEVLENGLPDWRQPVFYYRRVRKMSNVELSLLLFIILTVGHYAVVWSIYFEKQLDDLLSRKKREKKKKTSGKTMDEGKAGVPEKNERSVVKPHWQDLLPCKIGIWFYFFLKSLPQCYQDVMDFYLEWKEMKVKEKEEAETQAQFEAVQKEKRPKVKKPKSEFPVYTAPTSGSIAYVPLHEEASTIEDIEEQVTDWLEDRPRGSRKAPEWAEEDLRQLTRSMVKFPGGTPGRWEKIAHELGRSVADVTTKAKQVKDFVSSTPGTVKLLDLKSVTQTVKSAKRETVLPDHIITKRDEEVEGEHEFENGDDQDNYTEALSTETRPRKRKTAKTSERTLMIQEEIEQKQKGRRQRDFDNAELDDDSDEEKKRKGKVRPSEEIAELWNQNQQKLLELALQQYPKGTPERWEKIAKCVPGKTKEECIIRYKLLAELVMKRKQAKS